MLKKNLNFKGIHKVILVLKVYKESIKKQIYLFMYFFNFEGKVYNNDKKTLPKFSIYFYIFEKFM